MGFEKMWNKIRLFFNRLFKINIYHCYFDNGPDKNGNIYDKGALREAINQFNKKQKVIWLHDEFPEETFKKCFETKYITAYSCESLDSVDWGKCPNCGTQLVGPIHEMYNTATAKCPKCEWRNDQ